MTEYPRLAAMGVEHPEHISYFSISSLDHIDHLRIVYERPKGSFLPTIRSYRFPRVQKNLAKTGGTEVVMERCPEFREAVAELEKIMSLKEIKQDLTAAMLAQLQQLEEDVAMHTEYLKTLIEKIRSI